MRNLRIGTYKGKNVTLNASELYNKHVLLVGGSGCGKTVAAQNIMLQIAESGGTIYAIDSHGTLANDQIMPCFRTRFERCCVECDVYSGGFPIDIFSPVEYADGFVESSGDCAAAIVEIVSKPFNLGSNQKADLRRAVEHALEDKSFEQEGIKAVDTALRKIGSERAAGVREKLYSITRHNVFRPVKEGCYKGKIVVLRLGKFDLDSQIVLSEMFLAAMWRFANADKFKFGNEITMFLDECQNLPSGKGSMLATLLSEGRKFGLNLLMATQLLLDSSFSAAQQRFTQAGVILYFKPLDNRVSSTARLIDPSAKSDWTIVLRTLKIGEFVATGSFLLDGNAVDCPLKVSNFLTDSEPPNYETREKYVNGVGSKKEV